MVVSVVIPALDEEEHILDSVRSAVEDGAGEVVVVDGGSTDDTVKVARTEARVVCGDRGRARQMNLGAAESLGDVLLFLHADSRLSPGSIPAARRAIESGAVAGCYRLRFEPTSVLLDIYSAFTALPLNSLGFGDRGLFVSRDSFESLGGYSEIPVFEDLDIVRRLAESGRFVHLKKHVVTSSRRFMDHGELRQQAVNMALWTAYHLGVGPERLARYYPYPQGS